MVGLFSEDFLLCLSTNEVVRRIININMEGSHEVEIFVKTLLVCV